MSAVLGAGSSTVPSQDPQSKRKQAMLRTLFAHKNDFSAPIDAHSVKSFSIVSLIDFPSGLSQSRLSHSLAVDTQRSGLGGNQQ